MNCFCLSITGTGLQELQDDSEEAMTNNTVALRCIDDHDFTEAFGIIQDSIVTILGLDDQLISLWTTILKLHKAKGLLVVKPVL